MAPEVSEMAKNSCKLVIFGIQKSYFLDILNVVNNMENYYIDKNNKWFLPFVLVAAISKPNINATHCVNNKMIVQTNPF